MTYTVRAGDVASFELYDGSFDLSFLRPGETVASTGDGTGSCWISQPGGPDPEQGTRVEVGQVLERLADGRLVARDEP